ncbi:hypothetical protein PORCRE_472 [Porphyromonas crevioricanis JCM 15906]|uniref:Uncharacterized protein n=1 Tax=Porphyromonas crevioricanis JCM 15906 TaxID=1305617 RepID=T1CGH0_9PORP|nr:hypothetical protein PORCRE_472 [Porphyromonas crevioricanis JCM 15906]GAD08188.1 hypothetical protein PORCAN_1824 [Porphyromonas crevioricanis JCM 13913]
MFLEDNRMKKEGGRRKERKKGERKRLSQVDETALPKVYQTDKNSCRRDSL